MVELIKERKSYIDIRELTTVEWQTKTLATFLAMTAQSTEAMKAISDQAEKISIFASDKSKESPSKNGSAPEPRAGSAEKLAMLFGRRGARQQ
jgi:hypothetical protein